MKSEPSPLYSITLQRGVEAYEAQQWCNTNLSKRGLYCIDFSTDDTVTFYFFKEADATLFALKFS